LSYYQQLLAAT